MPVFREQTGALPPADQGYDQEARSRMDGKAAPTATMKMTDWWREANHFMGWSRNSHSAWNIAAGKATRGGFNDQEAKDWPCEC
jgi:hypothetical protein